MTRTRLTTNGFTHLVLVALAAAAVLSAVTSVAVANEKQDAVPSKRA